MTKINWKAALNARTSTTAAPTYRFRGSVSPAELPRTPLLNTAEATVVDGVATIRLYDPIDSWGGEWGVSAKEFAAVLDQLGDATEIRLHVNSPGGEVFEAVAIMNMLRAHPAKVVATVDGLAASSASFIAASADELIMARNSEFMIHDASGVAIGNAGDMRSTADLLDHLSDNIASVYAEKSGASVADFRAAMLAETWYSAQEAADAGLADSIAGEDEQAKVTSAKARADFDLSAFTYPSREKAPEPLQPAASADQGAEDRLARFMARRHAAKQATAA